MESKILQKRTYLQNRNRLTDKENRLVVAKGKSVGRGMRVADVSYYTQRGKAKMFYYIAQRTIFNVL